LVKPYRAVFFFFRELYYWFNLVICYCLSKFFLFLYCSILVGHMCLEIYPFLRISHLLVHSCWY
jgi:hypothetical protein